MPLNKYEIGQVVRMTFYFRVSDVLTDPSTLTVKVISPDGTETAYVYGVDSSLIRDSAGTYHLDVTASQNGHWEYRGESTGNAAGAEEHKFIVKETRFS